jgi:hypothetical protein
VERRAHRHDLHGDELSARAVHHGLVGTHALLGDRLPGQWQRRVSHELEDRSADQLFARLTEQLFEAPLDVEHHALATEHGQIEGFSGQLAQALFALVQQRQGPLALAHVSHGHHAHWLFAELALFGLQLDREPATVPVHAGDDVGALRASGDAAKDLGQILGRHAALDGLSAEQLGLVVAAHLRKALVGVDHHAVDVHENALERAGGQHLHTLAHALELVLLRQAYERAAEQAARDVAGALVERP